MMVDQEDYLSTVVSFNGRKFFPAPMLVEEKDAVVAATTDTPVVGGEANEPELLAEPNVVFQQQQQQQQLFSHHGDETCSSVSTDPTDQRFIVANYYPSLEEEEEEEGNNNNTSATKSGITTIDSLDATDVLEMRLAELQAENRRLRDRLELGAATTIPEDERENNFDDDDDEEQQQQQRSVGITSIHIEMENARQFPLRHRIAIWGAFLVVVALSVSLVTTLVAVLQRSQVVSSEMRADRIVRHINQATLLNKTLRSNASSTDPSEQALAWIIEEDPLLLTVEKNSDHLIQRFVLLTFLFEEGFGESALYSGSRPRHECDDARLNLYSDVWVCDDEGNIIELTAGKKDLKGAMPEDVGLLTHLSVLNFESNPRYRGTIPSTVGLLSNLRFLDLYNNGMTGTIPASIYSLTKLESIRLMDNNFSGTIPPEVGLLTNLQNLRVARNALSGPLPSTLGNLAKLNILWLQGNQFNGTVPVSLVKLQPRNALFYDNPGLTGTMPFCNSTMHETTTLVADCNRIDCPCCSYCCPFAMNGIEMCTTCFNDQ